MLDYIIPLGTGSKSDNDELRLLLRSLEKYATNLGRVIVVTDNPPAWLTHAVCVSHPDTRSHNKDGNMIDKVVTALETLDIEGEFVLSSDDNLLTGPCDLAAIPVVFNSRRRTGFNADKGVWHRRVLHTFELFKDAGIVHNYEAHVPQRFNARKIRDGIRGVDYETAPGYTICTLFTGLCGLINAPGEVSQDTVKSTHENAETCHKPLGRLFAGYNDAGFLQGNMRDEFFKRFPDKSIYEKP